MCVSGHTLYHQASHRSSSPLVMNVWVHSGFGFMNNAAQNILMYVFLQVCACVLGGKGCEYPGVELLDHRTMCVRLYKKHFQAAVHSAPLSTVQARFSTPHPCPRLAVSGFLNSSHRNGCVTFPCFVTQFACLC